MLLISCNPEQSMSHETHHYVITSTSPFVPPRVSHFLFASCVLYFVRHLHAHYMYVKHREKNR